MSEKSPCWTLAAAPNRRSRNGSVPVAQGLGIVLDGALRWAESRIDLQINHNLAKRQSYGLSHRGAHCFLLHPFFVAWGWNRFFGFTWDPPLGFAFALHDIGYIGRGAPAWLYLPMTRWTGELREYMTRSRQRQAGDNSFTGEEEMLVRSEVPDEWLRGLQSYTLRWVERICRVLGEARLMIIGGGRFSKLLNLKMRQKGAPCAQGRFRYAPKSASRFRRSRIRSETEKWTAPSGAPGPRLVPAIVASLCLHRKGERSPRNFGMDPRWRGARAASGNRAGYDGAG